jgi:hypothetical protein
VTSCGRQRLEQAHRGEQRRIHQRQRHRPPESEQPSRQVEAEQQVERGLTHDAVARGKLHAALFDLGIERGKPREIVRNVANAQPCAQRAIITHPCLLFMQRHGASAVAVKPADRFDYEGAEHVAHVVTR